MADDATQVVMQVPKDIIAAQVKAAVVGLLAKDGDRLVRELVEAVIREPSRDSYGRKSVLDEQIQKLIIELTQTIAKEYVEGLRPDITKEIHRRLGGAFGNKKVAAASFVEKLIDALCQNISVDINIRDFKDKSF